MKTLICLLTLITTTSVTYADVFHYYDTETGTCYEADTDDYNIEPGAFTPQGGWGKCPEKQLAYDNNGFIMGSQINGIEAPKAAQKKLRNLSIK